MLNEGTYNLCLNLQLLQHPHRHMIKICVLGNLLPLTIEEILQLSSKVSPSNYALLTVLQSVSSGIGRLLGRGQWALDCNSETRSKEGIKTKTKKGNAGSGCLILCNVRKEAKSL